MYLFTGTDYYFEDSLRVTITYENDCLTSYNPGFEFFYYTLDGNGKKSVTAIIVYTVCMTFIFVGI